MSSGPLSRRGKGDVAWIVRRVRIGADGTEHNADVPRIAGPDNLADLDSLGLTMSEISCLGNRG